MNQTIQSVINSLDDLGNSVRNAYSDNRTMNEVWGWNFPALSRNDLADLALNLSNKLRHIDIEKIDDSLKSQLEEIPLRVGVFKKRTLSYLFNGNGHQACPIYMSLLVWITNLISPLFDWEVVKEENAIPGSISKRLKSIQSELDEILLDKETVKSQIELIRVTASSSESVPAILHSLNESKKQVEVIAKDISEIEDKIKNQSSEVYGSVKYISFKKEESTKLVEQCEEAYRITTTKGLAGAFTQRADRLSLSMWLWVLGLLFALVSGILIGAHRFDILNKVMESKTHDWGQYGCILFYLF